MNSDGHNAIGGGDFTVVVKVGTRVLTDERGYLNQERIQHLAEQLVELRKTRRVVLVSSGAVAAGMSTLGYERRPTDLAELQAVAALGQAKLIQAYDHEFRRLSGGAGATTTFHAAQVLLGADDLQNRVGYLNVRNTLWRLMEFPNVIPVINENDTVSVEELQTTFGDNDNLAALVTNLLRAQLLIILSNVEGLYDHDKQLVQEVREVDDRVWSYVCDQKTGLSKGGMASKLKAAKLCMGCGETVVIANGREPNVLVRVAEGDAIGTRFLPHGKPLSPLKRWIGFPAQSRGKVYVDPGAREAILNQEGSLLAVGIVKVDGEFRKGDVISICVSGGAAQPDKEFARGLTNYSSADLEQIRGQKSQKIADVLGHRPYEEVVHRNNMVVVRR